MSLSLFFVTRPGPCFVIFPAFPGGRTCDCVHTSLRGSEICNRDPCSVSPLPYLPVYRKLLVGLSTTKFSEMCKSCVVQPARLRVQEPVFRVLNSEHLYKSLLAELPLENSSWGLGFQVSVLPPPLLDLGFPGPSCPPVGLAVNSGQHWVRLRGEGQAKQRRVRGWFSFQLPSSLAPRLGSQLYFKSSKSQRNYPQCGLFPDFLLYLHLGYGSFRLYQNSHHLLTSPQA